jgi:3-isopropylmalate dehydratase small subunit
VSAMIALVSRHATSGNVRTSLTAVGLSTTGLTEQSISILSTGEKETFEISAYKKDNMINGFDDIDYLQNIKTEIEEFASKLPL